MCYTSGRLLCAYGTWQSWLSTRPEHTLAPKKNGGHRQWIAASSHPAGGESAGAALPRPAPPQEEAGRPKSQGAVPLVAVRAAAVGAVAKLALAATPWAIASELPVRKLADEAGHEPPQLAVQHRPGCSEERLKVGMLR